MSSLYSMLGPGITDRCVFQWVKLIGRENIVSDYSKGQPIVIDRAHIVKSFYDSVSAGRTLPDLANIMLHCYLTWIQEPRQTRITGIIAEVAHDRIMLAISRQHLRKWEPEKHKNPYYGIINLFRITLSSVQCDLLPPLQGRVDARPKKRHAADIVNNWVDLGDNADTMQYKLFDLSHPMLEWDAFHQVDPLDQLIEQEETANEI